MLRRENRLKTRFQFNLVRKYGNKVNAKYFYFYFLNVRDYNGPTQIGFIATSKFNKKAVVRNRAKRLLREAFRQNFGKIKPGYWLVVYPKAEIEGKSYEEVSSELNKAISGLPFAN